MQLTKDDVKRSDKLDSQTGDEWLYFSKFQQVVAFYEKYKGNPETFPLDDAFKRFISQSKLGWRDWLFHFCFDGVK